MRDYVDDLIWGVGGGIGFALFLSAIALLVFAVTGGQAFVRAETTILQVLGIYWGSALVAGLLAALLRPIARWLLGAIVIGYISGLLMFFAIAATLDGWDYAMSDLRGVAFLALIGAATGGVGWYRAMTGTL